MHNKKERILITSGTKMNFHGARIRKASRPTNLILFCRFIINWLLKRRAAGGRRAGGPDGVKAFCVFGLFTR